MPKVYLAGPIADLSYREATDWRADVKKSLEAWGIHALSPMRNHEHLTTVQRLSKTEPQGGDILPTRTSKGIMSRDFYDVRTCDLVLVNLIGAQRISIGTTMEIAWAYQNRTPIVAAIEVEKTNIHEHGMLNEAIDFRCRDLQEALDTTISVLDVNNPINVSIKNHMNEREVMFAVERKIAEKRRSTPIPGGWV